MPENPKNVKDDWIMADTPEQLRDIRRSLDTIATPLNRIAQALNDLVPLVYYAVVVLIGVGMMGLGAAGLTGRGPMAK